MLNSILDETTEVGFTSLQNLKEILSGRIDKSTGVVQEKWKILFEQEHSNCFYVTGYPAALTEIVLRKVVSTVKFYEGEGFFEKLNVSGLGGQEYEFLLCKNSSNSHKELELKQQETGGILSKEVYDFGDIRIYKFSPTGEVVSAADYSLYRI